jgi:hypothetical protein
MPFPYFYFIIFSALIKTKWKIFSPMTDVSVREMIKKGLVIPALASIFYHPADLRKVSNLQRIHSQIFSVDFIHT